MERLPTPALSSEPRSTQDPPNRPPPSRKVADQVLRLGRKMKPLGKTLGFGNASLALSISDMIMMSILSYLPPPPTRNPRPSEEVSEPDMKRVQSQHKSLLDPAKPSVFEPKPDSEPDPLSTTTSIPPNDSHRTSRDRTGGYWVLRGRTCCG